MNLKNLLKNIVQRIKKLEYDLGLIHDYVMEYYQDGGKEGYAKWASGKMEVWKRISKQLTATISWGGVYYGHYSDNSITYTMTGFSGFVGYPNVQITIQCVNGNIMALVGDYSTYTTTGIGEYYVYSAASKSNVDATINVYAIGRWE